MKKILLLFIGLALSTWVRSQDFPYGAVSLEELAMKKYDKDTAAHAVVLQEFGDARINVDANDDLQLYYTYHVKIKIFDSKGFDKGDVTVKLYNGDNNNYETIDDIKAGTFYTADNGAMQSVELDPKKVYTVKEDKHFSSAKFALPNIHAGSVIEYSYKVTSPFFFETLHSWEFQDDIPKVYSEYLIHVPAFFNYKAVLRGKQKLAKSGGVVEDDCFTLRGQKNPCSKLTYAMANIPAFVEEDYMTSPKNFLSAIYFELEEYTNPYTYVKEKVTKEWKDIDQRLKSDEDFGSQLKKKDLLRDRVKTAVAGKTDPMEKAKAIYGYLQKWFKWNDYYGIYSSDGVRKALDSHSGSIGDINLSLVAALNSADIPTEAVLVSTREHGAINVLYPDLSNFNYVIAKATIGDKTYLLDASDPLLAFGMLPLRCLNDKGRVFSLDKPSYWMDMTTPQRENDTYNFDLKLQTDGKISGTITHYSMGYSAYRKRKEIKKFNSADEYVENLDEKLPKLKILKSDIGGLDSLDLPITEKYEVEINAFDNTDHNRLTFNPYFFDHITVNPFKLAERDYPVDWGMPSDTRYIVNMKLPDDFVIENPPQNISVGMPNNGGRFIAGFETQDNNKFTFSHVTSFAKSIYFPNEYPYLKELYNKIIQSQKGELVFKKKS